MPNFLTKKGGLQRVAASKFMCLSKHTNPEQSLGPLRTTSNMCTVVRLVSNGFSKLRKKKDHQTMYYVNTVGSIKIYF